jgi:hypothetical protein
MTETMIIAEAEVEAEAVEEEDDDDGLPDHMNSSGKSTKNKDNSKNKNNKNCVRFGTVTVRNYGMTLGTNPATSIGSPVCLEWDYEQLQPVVIDDYEITKNFGRIVQIENKNRSPREFYLNYYKRRGILERAGFTDKDFTSMERKIKYERLQRKITLYQSFPVLYPKSWKIASAQRKSKQFVRNYRKEHTS